MTRIERHREAVIAIGGLIAIERKFLSASELTERNDCLGRLEMMPPASECLDFIPGYRVGKSYCERRAILKGRIASLSELALDRAGIPA
jgi:hypothetical protein